jgi:hypothetical protein
LDRFEARALAKARAMIIIHGKLPPAKGSISIHGKIVGNLWKQTLSQ